MNLGKISVRYARALFLIAGEQEKLDLVAKDMELLLQTSMEVPSFRNFQDSPILTHSKKKEGIHEVFGDKLQDITLTFLDLIIINNRLPFIEGIARQFIDQYKKSKGITSVVLTTAKPVSQELKEKLVNFIKGKTTPHIKLNVQIEPALIGGFILKVEDEQIDSSVSTQLKKIKKELTRRQLSADHT